MAEGENKRPKRKLRNFLLNGRLQLRYVFLVTGFSAAIAAGLGWVIYQQSSFASQQIIAAIDAPGMEWLGAATKAEVRTQLGRSDLRLVAAMVGIGLGLALVLMAFLIVMTHKVAGPLHRLGAYFNHMRQGELPQVGRLRKGDQFNELFDTLRSTSSVLQERLQSDRRVLETFINACANKDGERSKELTLVLAELKEAGDKAK